MNSHAAVPWQTISEVSDELRTGTLTSVALTELMFDRIEQCDPVYHSYLTLMRESALQEAQQADGELKAGIARGPLHGIPVAVKDLCCTKGTVTTSGMAILADYIPDMDATVVTRLRQAGAVLLGKLSMTEGAMGGYHSQFQVPKNPWNKGVWTGVSSSGSGVATAAGLAFGTLGSDTGGSIRFPAAACGVVGMKPTWGRVSRYGVFPLAESLDHVGPMARSSADCAAVLQAIAGRDPNDPTSLLEDVPDYLAEIDRPIDGVVVGWDERYASNNVHPELTAALSDAIDELARLGAKIRDVELPDLSDVTDVWFALAATEAATAHADTFPQRQDEYGAYLTEFLQHGAQVSGTEYAAAHIRRLQIAGRLRQVFEGIDVLACPSMNGPPIEYPEEESYSSTPFRLMEDLDLLQFTAPYDFTGQPTLSTPCGLTSNGLPLSLQLVAKHLDESLLFRVGHAFEQSKRFNRMHADLGV